MEFPIIGMTGPYSYNNKDVMSANAWVLREYLPKILEEAGFAAEGAALRSLPEVNDRLQLVQVSREAREAALNTTEAARLQWCEQNNEGLKAHYDKEGRWVAPLLTEEENNPYWRAYTDAYRVFYWFGNVVFGKFGSELAELTIRFIKELERKLEATAE